MICVILFLLLFRLLSCVCERGFRDLRSLRERNFRILSCMCEISVCCVCEISLSERGFRILSFLCERRLKSLRSLRERDFTQETVHAMENFSFLGEGTQKNEKMRGNV